MNKNTIQKFNNKKSLLVIASYPEKGMLYSGKVCAVGGFAKNTVVSMQKELARRGEKRNIIVLTVTTGKKEMYVEDGVLVVRCFKRNNISSYLNLIKTLGQFGKVKDVLVEFEFASFGDTSTTGLFPLMLMLFRILGKHTTLVLHQVVTNLKDLSSHVGLPKNGIKMSLFDRSLKLFYFALTIFPQKVVVLEQVFKEKLAGLTNSNKIVVIPHGVDTHIQNLPKRLARKKLGIPDDHLVLLYFGYLTWYKGADWIAKEAKLLKDMKVTVIMAGGESFTQRKKRHYHRFVDKVKQYVGESNNVVLTGFVPEQNIPVYFSASDFVVFPYRTMLSSSGPLSLAFSFEKPVLLSNALKGYLLSSDFNDALNKVGLSKEDVFFPLKGTVLFRKLKTIDEDKRSRFKQFSRLLSEKRSFATLALQYADVLFPSSPSEHKNIFAVWKNYLLYNCFIVSKTIASRVAPFTRRL